MIKDKVNHASPVLLGHCSQHCREKSEGIEGKQVFSVAGACNIAANDQDQWNAHVGSLPL
jgi:hypothetical protein